MSPLCPRVGLNNCAPGSAARLSGRATAHPSAALATGCFAYSNTTLGPGPHANLRRQRLARAPPALPCSPFPLGLLRLHIPAQSSVPPEPRASTKETPALPPQAQEAGRAAHGPVLTSCTWPGTGTLHMARYWHPAHAPVPASCTRPGTDILHMARCRHPAHTRLWGCHCAFRCPASLTPGWKRLLGAVMSLTSTLAARAGGALGCPARGSLADAFPHQPVPPGDPGPPGLIPGARPTSQPPPFARQERCAGSGGGGGSHGHGGGEISSSRRPGSARRGGLRAEGARPAPPRSRRPRARLPSR